MGEEEQPPHLCLRAEDPVLYQATINFDIDSVVGFPSSLAIARTGIQ